MFKKANKYHFITIVLSMMAISTVPTVANAVAGDSTAQSTNILNTSLLYADHPASYHACNVVNVTTANLKIKIDLINISGTVLGTTGTTPITLNAGLGYELIANPGSNYIGFARCRISVVDPANVRANLTVFHSTGTYFESLAVSEAR